MAPREMPTEILSGEGWTLRVLEGSRVRAEEDRLSVDAPDGRRWFDITWLDDTRTPEAIAHAWSATTCSPTMWDVASTPVEDTWFSGAVCVIDDRRFYALVAVETFGNRRLLTTYVAQDGFISYENAWVDFVTTAMSLRTGDSPLPAPDVEALRADIRHAAVQPAGPMPVPGGGLLSGRISREIPEWWSSRHAAPPPPDLSLGDGAGSTPDPAHETTP